MVKMGAEITFAPDGSAQLHLVPREEEWRLYTSQSKDSPLEPELEEEFRWSGQKEIPLAWPRTTPRLGHSLSKSVNIQFQGIQVHLDQLLQWKLLKWYQSPWNTPLLPVKKPGTNDYCPVQDLRAVNEAVIRVQEPLLF
ncbi:hypothetical protein QTO34_013778 [Cnephaeus nilssonii]|uniref:Uncharacterized protein n=1 Tax=Cnephaeus nilssonii TaxID=3371016 RepID=A0AA40LV83_CNENI|nr:hypothetical protein QTO34_013778 [Eptesicus nilssonii]